MLDDLVVTRLRGLEQPLCLTRRPDGAGGGDPAVLVVPRGGRLREPRLALLTGRSAGVPPGGDAHVVARFDDFADRDRREVADVLVGHAMRPSCPPAERMRRVLDHYPGCSVAVGRSPQGCLAALRDGRLAEIAGPADPPWPAVYGSFLYCWSAAGLPLDDLARAALVVGWLPQDGPPVLAVAGGIRVRPVAPDLGWRAAS